MIAAWPHLHIDAFKYLPEIELETKRSFGSVQRIGSASSGAAFDHQIALQPAPCGQLAHRTRRRLYSNAVVLSYLVTFTRRGKWLLVYHPVVVSTRLSNNDLAQL